LVLEDSNEDGSDHLVLLVLVLLEVCHILLGDSVFTLDLVDNDTEGLDNKRESVVDELKLFHVLNE
jgi:Na+-transporting NADH:ubiquinone oxidoreductase subunit NqrC